LPLKTQSYAEMGMYDPKLNLVLNENSRKKILLLDVRFTYYMDFVNNNIKRLGPRYPTGPHDLYQLPKKNPSELEQIHNQIISSIKFRMQNLPNEHSNQNFEKMVNQMRGQDTSAISNLTKDFLKTTRKNLSE
jgi:hypothetical protein